ncbi:hypothetical protein TNCV_3441691 [Trichonephila clavipes]|nr:hypothetical protein TNCV_3441691 [Trichonephila clavipes]
MIENWVASSESLRTTAVNHAEIAEHMDYFFVNVFDCKIPRISRHSSHFASTISSIHPGLPHEESLRRRVEDPD